MSRTNEVLSRKRKGDSVESGEPEPDGDLLYLFDLDVLAWLGQDLPGLDCTHRDAGPLRLEKVPTFSV